MNGPEQVDALCRQRIQRMNHNLRRWFDVDTRPKHPQFGHAPYCPQGARCCCSQRWVTVQR